MQLACQHLIALHVSREYQYPFSFLNKLTMRKLITLVELKSVISELIT